MEQKLQQTTQKHHKELQRWADMQKEFTDEVYIFHQQCQDILNLLDEQRQSCEELRES
jgi:hypothetical protein